MGFEILLALSVLALGYAIHASRRPGVTFEDVAASFWMGLALLGLCAPQVFLEGWVAVGISLGVVAPALALSMRSSRKAFGRYAKRVMLSSAAEEREPGETLIRRADAEDLAALGRRLRRRGMALAFLLGGVSAAIGAVLGSAVVVGVGLAVGITGAALTRYVCSPFDEGEPGLLAGAEHEKPEVPGSQTRLGPAAAPPDHGTPGPKTSA